MRRFCAARAVLWVTVLALAGCQEHEEIRHYRQERPEPPKPVAQRTGAAEEATGDVKMRILAAALKDGERHWYFKLRGPAEKIARHEAEFDQFLRSVKLTKDADPPVSWTVPQGWREAPKVQFSAATYQMGPADDPVTLTISPVGDTLLNNLNRWRRDQLGLPIVEAADLAKVTTDIQGQNVTLVRADFVGPDPQPNKVRLLGAALPDGDRHWYFKMMGPAEKIARHEAEFDQFLRSVKLTKDADPPVSWTVPQGWREAPKTQFSIATFRMGPDDDPVTLTVSPVGDTLLNNINRWRRDQLGIKMVDAAELPKVTTEVQGQNVTLVRVDFAGPGGKGKMPPFARSR